MERDRYHVVAGVFVEYQFRFVAAEMPGSWVGRKVGWILLRHSGGMERPLLEEVLEFAG